jgi:repressor LexA
VTGSAHTGSTPGTPDRPDPGHVLTWRQRKILRFIADCVARSGYPPSMEEIGEAVGLVSVSSVSYQMSVLERKGYLHRDGRRPRTVEVRMPRHQSAPDQENRDERTTRRSGGTLDIPSQAAVYVPVLGQMAAGRPILAREHVEDVFPLPRRLVGDGTLFLLKVAGDSMINAAILDGDWVVVRQQDDAQSGEIVAIMVRGEVTVKTLKRSGGSDWLVSHNPAYTPIPGDDATILGKVVAVLRRVGDVSDDHPAGSAAPDGVLAP